MIQNAFCKLNQQGTAWKELQNDFTIFNALGHEGVMKSDKTERTEQGVNKSNSTHTGRDYKLTIA